MIAILILLPSFAREEHEQRAADEYLGSTP